MITQRNCYCQNLPAKLLRCDMSLHLTVKWASKKKYVEKYMLKREK